MLQLPLLDRIPVVVDAAVPVAHRGKDVMVTNMLIEDVLALLMLITDC